MLARADHRPLVRGRRRSGIHDPGRGRPIPGWPRRHGPRCSLTAPSAGRRQADPVPARSCWAAPPSPRRASADACWAAFETGRLDVPAILLGIVDGAAVLTCSLIVRAVGRPVIGGRRTARSSRSALRRVRGANHAGGQVTRRSGSTRSADIRTVRRGPRRSPAPQGPSAGDASTRWSWPVGSTSAHRAPIDVHAVLGRLARRRQATIRPPTSAPVTVFAFSRGGRTFLGASPERLVAATRPVVPDHRPRGHDGPGPRSGGRCGASGAALLASEKDREEHAVVVEMLRDTLAPLAARLDIDRTPHRRAAAHAAAPRHRHLRRPARRPGHPGPRGPAAPDARGGWLATRGRTGAARGAGASRSGLVRGPGRLGRRSRGRRVRGRHPVGGHRRRDQAHLFVGCGIVADSEPDREWAESSLKLQSLATALGRLDP